MLLRTRGAGRVQTEMRRALLTLVVGATACQPSAPSITAAHDAAARRGGDSGGEAQPQSLDASFSVVFPDAHYEATTQKVVVYAHTGSDLVSVDPETLNVSRVGNF